MANQVTPLGFNGFDFKITKLTKQNSKWKNRKRVGEKIVGALTSDT